MDPRVCAVVLYLTIMLSQGASAGGGLLLRPFTVPPETERQIVADTVERVLATNREGTWAPIPTTIDDRHLSLLKSVRTESGAPEDAGVRLERSMERPGSIGVAFRDGPEAGDQVVEESGLRVFVPEALADELSDRTLDVQSTPQGAALALM